ncbi:hypothetical protein GUITHDRAFT_153637, partial [Guillardia theta CCMP2712]
YHVDSSISLLLPFRFLPSHTCIAALQASCSERLCGTQALRGHPSSEVCSYLRQTYALALICRDVRRQDL